MTPDSTPARGTKKPAASLSGVGSLLGKIFAGGLVVAAGVGGWMAVEAFDVSLPATEGSATTALATALPSLGDGLPDARLQSPAPWRQFSLTYQSDTQTNRFWIDLDAWRIRIESDGADGATAVEIAGDSSFTRAADGSDWIEQDAPATQDLTAWLMTGVGPFVLTDLVPPETLGFTTLELEGTSRGERVYEVAVDAATLQEQHPLAHQRWLDATRLVSDSSGVYRIRVREDGYIVRIDGDTTSVQWDDLIGGVVFFSPLDPETAGPPVVDPAGDPAADPAADPNAEPAAADAVSVEPAGE